MNQSPLADACFDLGLAQVLLINPSSDFTLGGGSPYVAGKLIDPIPSLVEEALGDPGLSIRGSFIIDAVSVSRKDIDVAVALGRFGCLDSTLSDPIEDSSMKVRFLASKLLQRDQAP